MLMNYQQNGIVFIDEMMFILPSSVPLDGTGGANI